MSYREDFACSSFPFCTYSSPGTFLTSTPWFMRNTSVSKGIASSVCTMETCLVGRRVTTPCLENLLDSVKTITWSA